MTTDSPKHNSESDEPLERKLDDAVEQTETLAASGSPVASRIAIEGYEIDRELHRGGQGVVYVAVQKSTKRKVAIKILLEGRFASSSARRRFQREVALAAGLKHPNIIAIFDSGETPDGQQFCVMDYVRGRSIHDHVRHSKLSLKETLKLFSSVCEAAHFANRRGVVHRDLKPSNIIVDSDGVPRVLDFGLAKQLAGGTQSLVSMTGQVMGTLQYMSPEQTRGNPDEIDARSDVYSLGVILYELLTGVLPYSAKGEMVEILKRIVETEPTPPSKVWTVDLGVPRRKARRFRAGECPIDDELQTIVLKALAKDRDRRYQSVGALREDIFRYLEGQPIAAKRDSSLYVLKKTLRRHRGRIVATLGAIAVALITLFAGLQFGGRGRSAIVSPGSFTSLAVLPLENLSGDPGQDYFADGMTEALIADLAKISALRVISRTSIMRYKRTTLPLPQIADELNVDVIVEGSVMREGDRVRITAQLIEAASDRHLWAESYVRDVRDILALQGEVARAIAQEIRITLTGDERTRLTSTRQINRLAHEAYLKGRYHWNKFNEQDFKKALDYFRQAIEYDPMYAAAYAGLADSYGILANTGSLEPQKAFPKAKAYAQKALDLDETLAEAHASLGGILVTSDWNWAAAEEEFLRAIQLQPGNATAHHWYAVLVLMPLGRFDDAHAQIQRAKELDPLSLLVSNAVGWIYYFQREYDKAIDSATETLDMQSAFSAGHELLGACYTEKGMYEKAIAAYQEAIALSNRHPSLLASLGRAYALAGRREPALVLLKELTTRSREKYVPAFFIAKLYMGLGDNARTFEWLDRAYVERSNILTRLNRHPAFDSIRGDPRFEQLMLRVGLVPELKPHTSAKPPATEAPHGKIKLAVLPFKDLSPDPQEWFSDGMTEELIATLAKIEAVGVISRTSVMRFKKTNQSLPEIARALGADKLIEGSVLRVGGQVRITVQLIDAATDTHVWSNSYQRDERDILALQSEIARTVAREIQVTLTPSDQAKLADAREVVPAAHEAYLKGRYWWNKRTEDGLKRSLTYFQEAIDKDPLDALAHAGLAQAYVVLGGHKYVPPEYSWKLVRADAEKAIALDETLGEAHIALAVYKASYEWDWHGAEKEFKRGIQLNPSHATGHQWYAEFLASQGRMDEALKEIRDAREIAPTSRIIQTVVGLIYYRAQRYDDVIEQCTETLDFDPDFAYAHLVLGLAYAEKAMFEEAISEINEAIALGGRSTEYVTALGYVYAAAKMSDQAKRILDELKRRAKTQYVAAYDFAFIHAGLGDENAAFHWLDLAVEERGQDLSWLLKVDPKLESLHSDPRFADLLRRVGFEPPPAPDAMNPDLSGARGHSKGCDSRKLHPVFPVRESARFTEQVGTLDTLGQSCVVFKMFPLRRIPWRDYGASLPSSSWRYRLASAVCPDDSYSAIRSSMTPWACVD